MMDPDKFFEKHEMLPKLKNVRSRESGIESGHKKALSSLRRSIEVKAFKPE
jgi:hypothetical protein